MTLNFNKQGKDRKPLVVSLSQALEAEAQYLGIKGGYAYQVGEYHIDKNGTVTGPDNRVLADTLETYGFTPDSREFDEEETDTSVAETEASEAETEQTTLAIEIPLDDFTPAKIDNLRRMVEAKANLLKTAFGVDELPIQVKDDRISFPWYKGEELPSGEIVEAYSTFISQLCKTAIKKTRVTASARDIEGSEKYAMRCFMLSLNMIGAEYQNSRRTLLANFEGDSSWKYGKPEKTAAAQESSGVAPGIVGTLQMEDENGRVVSKHTFVVHDEIQDDAGVDDWEELPDDAEIIHDDDTDENEGEDTMEFNTEKTEHEMMLEQLPEGTQILRMYNAAENGELRVITDEDGQKRYVVTFEDGYPLLTHKP